jgi:hypothetical protein
VSLIFYIIDYKYFKRHERLILNFTMESNKKISKEEWIKKDLKSKIPKLDKKTIFVPRKNELTF